MQYKGTNGIRLRDQFAGRHVLIVGDVMVDEYVVGKVKRISPEAPIPVLNYTRRNQVAGGASNVASNVAGLGAKVEMAGVVGDDDAGRWVKQCLANQGISTDGMVTEAGRPTTVKRRFATKSQQLLRVDIENPSSISIDSQYAILQYIEGCISKMSAVILSDYRKGVLASVDFVKRIIQICKAHSVVVTVDSKSSNIEAFADASFVKPNNLELEQASGVAITDDASLDEAGTKYLFRSGADALIVTRGAKGISVFERGEKRRDYPSKAAQVYDVTGAGDTVISTATMALAADIPLPDAVVLGNIAAGIVVSRTGTVPITIEELETAIYGPLGREQI